jgi:hypothetical protein
MSFLILSILLLSQISFAENENINSLSSAAPADSAVKAPTKIFFPGHNLTPTTDTLSKGEITVGTYVIGYGVTDRLTIATSPWFDYFYNMPMINGRLLVFQQNDFRVTTEVNFFKTYDTDTGYYSRAGVGYEQTSAFLRVAASEKFSNFYTLTGSLGYQYFWDDLKPYSFRLVPGNTDPYNASASTLHKFSWTRHFGNFLEAGVMGLNYQTPYLHLGASIYGQWKWGLLLLGFSRTSSMGQVHYVTSYDDEYFEDVVVHPEVQFQTYF